MANKQLTAKAGKTIGRYVIERELGRGGMGVVYLATDANLGRRVALKTTSIAQIGSSEMARGQRQARFNREVKALTQVNHDNVVHVFDSGEADDPELGWVLYYTMQFVDGITLAQMVHRMGGLQAGAAAAVCRQVAAGLGASHKVGIVHRDVKPANIFIAKSGRALIGDFGICKLEGSTQITRRDQLVGTPNYLAPEQILGEEITAATDVFALGALFFVIVTNRPLRDKVDPASLLTEAQTNDPKKKMLAQKNVPDGVRKVVAKALERDPKKRWADGQAFADALTAFATRVPLIEEATAARRASPAPIDTNTSPFAPMPLDDDTPFEDAQPSNVVGPQDFAGSGAAGVEEAALAMLKEAGIKDDKPAKKRRKKKKAPAPKTPDLPVARAESTVMYNLRKEGKVDEPATDDDNQAPLLEPRGAASDALPVARAESTVMYNLRQAEAEHRAQQKSAPAPAGQGDGLPDGDTNPALDEDTGPQTYEPDPTPDPAPVAQPAMKKVGAGALGGKKGARAPLPPAAILAGVGGAGFVLAIVLLALIKLAVG